MFGLQIDHASLGLDREYLIRKFEEPLVQHYHDYQVDLAELLGASRADAEREMREVLDFEFLLADVIEFSSSKFGFFNYFSFNRFQCLEKSVATPSCSTT